MTTPKPQTAPLEDVLANLRAPDPSPTLTVLRDLTEDGKKFTIENAPPGCPELPPLSEKVPAGRRAHTLETLEDLRRYVVEGAKAAETAIAFYTPNGVSVILDESADTEREVIKCSLSRTAEFYDWDNSLSRTFTQADWVRFLRDHKDAIDRAAGDATQAKALIGEYSSLRGELVHHADDFLDMQRASATFTVKRKSRGKDDQIEAQVSTSFAIAIRILPDDEEPTTFTVNLRFTGDASTPIQITPTIEGFADQLSAHIDEALEHFSQEAGFLCLRGTCREEAWSEPRIPAAIADLLEIHRRAIAAAAGLDTIPAPLQV